MALERSHTDAGGVRILTLAGKLESSTLGELERQLLDWLGAGRRSLLIDLSELELVDGRGLRMLVRVGKRMEAVGGRLAICRPHGEVRRAFGRVETRLKVFASRADAEAWLSQSVHVARVALLADSLLLRRAAPTRKRLPAKQNTRVLRLAARLLGLAETSPSKETP